MDALRPFSQSMSPESISYYRRLTAEYEAYCQQQMDNHFMAAKFNFKSCQRCGYCCLCYPCIPRPDEIAPAARYLEMTISDFVNKYMVADTADCQIFFLRWAKEGQEDITGARIPPWRTYDRGYCVLFDKGKKSCRIHPVRPSEAKLIKCWDNRQSRDKKLWGMSSWGKDDIFAFLPDFDPKYFRNAKLNTSSLIFKGESNL
ncbi:MAG: YkgJ family cysteine cluster protein [Dehalococcoides mccartyi]|uniref:YkgJ family cysteine cluster protein n=1 Tax=Dehalococcoides mccartyi TaxID=61435 RepID=UPI0030FBF9F7